MFEQFQFPIKNPILVFSIILLIILFSPIILKRINIPSLIGLIISGIIIGPYGVNLIEKNSAVELFSTIGLLYIMFIAGLELDLNLFIANRKKSIIFGFLTFIIPITLGFLVFYYFLNYGFIASFLISSMFATQTLVAYPIVSRLGVSKNEAVAITVGATIFTDTAVLINLAIIKNVNNVNIDSSFWISLGVSLILFLLVMFIVIPRIAKSFFQKHEGEKYSHYIFVLFILFLSSFLAQASGLEPIIGAFAAGIVLNSIIPHSSALMNRIEFMGNSLFIPFFLISVGMIIDIKVLFSGFSTILLTLILIFIALITKYFVAKITQLLFKYSNAQGQLLFGLSSAHAATILVFILVGYNAHIINDDVLNATIILILVTCVVSSIITEKAAKQIVIKEVNTIRYDAYLYNWEYLLIPIINFQNLEKLLRLAIIIKDKKSPNPISILSIVPNDVDAEINVIKSREKIESKIDTAISTETPINIIVSIDHNPIYGIIRTAKEVMSNYVLIGWPKKADLIDKLLGDSKEKLIYGMDKNIFFIHFEKPLITTKRIILLTPPFADKEYGFEWWFSKVLKMSNELTAPILHFGRIKTNEAMNQKIKEYGISVQMSFNEFIDWEDFLFLSKYIKNNDLIIFISAKKQSLSYNENLETIPYKLEKYFSEYNRIVIYPQQAPGTFSVSYENYDFGGFSNSKRTMNLVGKGIRYIFKKTDNN